MRRARALLIASLLLNLFLVGAIAGGLWRWTGGGRGPGGWRRQAIAALPPARAEAFRATLRAARMESRPQIEQARAARGEAARALAAAAFDPATATAALDRARAADFQVRARLEGQVIGFAATLTPAERRLLADALRPTHPRRPGRNPNP